jgi:hypothetical protein
VLEGVWVIELFVINESVVVVVVVITKAHELVIAFT